MAGQGSELEFTATIGGGKRPVSPWRRLGETRSACCLVLGRVNPIPKTFPGLTTGIRSSVPSIMIDTQQVHGASLPYSEVKL